MACLFDSVRNYFRCGFSADFETRDEGCFALANRVAKLLIRTHAKAYNLACMQNLMKATA